MQRLYSLSSVLTYEPQVDRMVEYFVKKLDGYCDGRPTLDVGQMLLFCINPLLSTAASARSHTPDPLLQLPLTSSVLSHSANPLATWRKNATLTDC
jgi:hypothetical protein